jgi:transaldolase
MLPDAPNPLDFNVSIYADGADIDGLRSLAEDPLISGFTTNPTLMRKAGVTDYTTFAHSALDVIGDRPISFEVFSDVIDEMELQARVIASWGPNVFVKIPITTTSGEPTTELVRRLSQSGVQVNVTAVMTLAQVESSVAALQDGAGGFVSVFAGRIADTGRDPIPLLEESLNRMAAVPEVRLIWASPRELLNIIQANQLGCDVITVTYDLLSKLRLLNKDLDDYSLETVLMFHDDANAADYSITTRPSGTH